jgi:hypothetical protein
MTGRALGACALMGLLAGCGGGTPSGGTVSAVPQVRSLDVRASGTLPQVRMLARFGRALRVHPAGGDAWMDPSATTSDLLYVSDTGTSEVYVFSYPQGKPKGALTGLSDPAGECVDAHGNVFVTNTGGFNVLEYAHGGTKPIATLKDAGYFPVGCAIDPKTGNLAVTNFSTSSSTQGNVVIYKGAKGRPTGFYSNPNISEMLLCGYDASGNLFVDGTGASSAAELAELPSGKAKLVPITLNQPISLPGGVQWDGKHMTFGDQSSNTIYRFAVSGKTGKRVGATVLGNAVEVFQYWIAGRRAIGPDAGNADVGVWSYPAGGTPVKTITGVYVPLGATVSKAL